MSNLIVRPKFDDYEVQRVKEEADAAAPVQAVG